jgi:signal transduction histidine kinase
MLSPRLSRTHRVQFIALLNVVVFAIGVTLLAARAQLAELALTLVFSAVVMLSITVGAIFLGRRERSQPYVRWLLAIASVFALVAFLAGAFGWDSTAAIVARAYLPFAGILTVVLFDSGRPTTWVDRRITIPLLVVSAVVLLLVFMTSRVMPPGVVVPQCDASCGSGLLNVVDAPGVGDALARFYLVLRAIVVVAMSVGIVQRLRRLTGSRRTEFVYLGIAGLLWSAGVFIQATNQIVNLREYGTLDSMYAAQFVLRLIVPIALCTGLMVAELRRGSVLEDEFRRIRSATTVDEVRDHLSVLLEDRSLRIVPAGGDLPEAPVESALTDLRTEDGRLVATVVHRHDLERETPAAFALGIPAASGALQRIDLTRRASALADEVAAARVAALSAGDAERARIERDLHDGAQARIVMLRARINHLARDAGSARDDLTEGITELGADLDAMLEEVRSLSSGLRPIRPGTLAPALRDQVVTLPLQVDLRTGDLGDLPEDLELAVYFCIREALQNVVKHAGPGASARVGITRDGDTLRFVVEDDGVGVPADGSAMVGSGITGMRTRMMAVGGGLTVRALPGGGTRVAGEAAVQAVDAALLDR